ncbi:hypothetical protein ABC304_06925 [Microbacterium sp. 1P10UB]|uniref:hypothetical protein n=1 Tax=unclassified Microbacterium TaxID=2609290 RepID=UPI00399F39CE
MRVRTLATIAVACTVLLGGVLLSPAAEAAATEVCPTVLYRSGPPELSYRASLIASDAGSIAYVGDLSWCVATRFSQITNNSKAVWVVSGGATPRGSTTLMTAMRTQTLQAYRAAGLLAPAFILPGETVAVDRTIPTVSIDPALTRQWIAFSSIGEPLIEFVDLITAQVTPKWNAAWKCAQGAVAFVETASLDQVTIDQVIEAAYKASDTAKSCRELASEAERIGRNRTRQIVVLTTADDLIRAASSVDETFDAAAAHSMLTAYCRLVPSRLGC